MVFLEPSEYTGFQREVVEKVNAALPAVMWIKMVDPGGTAWTRDLQVTRPVRWSAGERPVLMARQEEPEVWYEVCPFTGWRSTRLGEQAPLGAVYHIHPRCEVRARVNGIQAWNQVEALERFDKAYYQLLERALSRTLERVPDSQWEKGTPGCVLYTELDGIVGAIVDEAGDVDYDKSHTYEHTLEGWKKIE